MSEDGIHVTRVIKMKSKTQNKKHIRYMCPIVDNARKSLAEANANPLWNHTLKAQVSKFLLIKFQGTRGNSKKLPNIQGEKKATTSDTRNNKL